MSSLAHDGLKLDVALHVVGGLTLGVAAAALPWYAWPASVVCVYVLVGELRETFQKLESGDIGPFGRKRRIEALAWPIGAMLGIAIRAMM